MTLTKRLACLPLLSALLAGTALAQDFHDRRTVQFPNQVTADNPQRAPAVPRKQGFDGTLVLKGGRIFDSVKDTAYPGSIVVQQNKIVAILSPASADWPADAVVMDIAGKTVMPGLIDMHVHPTHPVAESPEDQRGSEGSATLRGLRNLQLLLETGVTSVRDQGGPRDAPFIVSEWLEKDMAPGPRVFAAGHIITGTGGHTADRGTNYFALMEEGRRNGNPPNQPTYTREANGADDWRMAVREMFKMGASHIKVASHFAPDEIKAAVEEAHRLGLKITCDCETIYIRMAIDAGVDTIEHPLPRSDEDMRMMVKRGVGAISTMQSYQNIFDIVGVYAGTASRRFSMGPTDTFQVLKRLKASGVTIGVGTDAIGGHQHSGPDMFKQSPNPFIAELKFLVLAGFTKPGALITATRTNAQLIDMGDKLGTIEVGKLADIIVVNGAPDQDLDALRNVETVIRNGNIVVQDGRLFAPRHVSVPLAKPSPPATLH